MAARVHRKAWPRGGGRWFAPTLPLAATLAALFSLLAAAESVASDAYFDEAMAKVKWSMSHPADSYGMTLTDTHTSP